MIWRQIGALRVHYGASRWCSHKQSICQCRRLKRHGFDSWVRKVPEEGNGNPLQYSCLENAMDRGAQRAAGYMMSQRVRRDWEVKHACQAHVWAWCHLTGGGSGVWTGVWDQELESHGFSLRSGWFLPARPIRFFKSRCNKLHIFKVYNLISFDMTYILMYIYVYLWTHHHNQDNEHNFYPPKFDYAPW